MLLFSTSDFICIGIVALPLTLVIISGGSISPRFNHWPVRHCAGGDDAIGLADGGRHS